MAHKTVSLKIFHHHHHHHHHHHPHPHPSSSKTLFLPFGLSPKLQVFAVFGLGSKDWKTDKPSDPNTFKDTFGWRQFGFQKKSVTFFGTCRCLSSGGFPPAKGWGKENLCFGKIRQVMWRWNRFRNCCWIQMKSLTCPARICMSCACIVVESKLPELLKVRVTKYRDQGHSDLSGKKHVFGCFLRASFNGKKLVRQLSHPLIWMYLYVRLAFDMIWTLRYATWTKNLERDIQHPQRCLRHD